MENKLDILEKYLLNELSVREQARFEDELRSDPELMKEFVLRKKINEAVLEDDVMNLRDTLGEIMSEDLSSRRPARKLYVYSAVAAVIILLIVVSNNIFFQSKNLSGQDVFDEYYSTYPVIVSLRSAIDETEIEHTLNKAFNSYDERNYEQASIFFKEAITGDSTNYMGQFYLSICKIETGELQEAEEYLADLVLQNNHMFCEQSCWYLAMVYLKEDKLDSAKNILNKIVQENMTQKQEAKSILKTLK